jgi:U3 small nucleolar ribonucleoprotein component
MEIRGFATQTEARAHQQPEKFLLQQDREFMEAKKRPVYTKAEAEHPKDFWKKWIVKCPAFRSDRIQKSRFDERLCHAMAIVTKKEGRRKWISCPECGYEGEYFSFIRN